MSPTIEVRNLHRTYGSGTAAFEAVRGVDLSVGAGTITALLGTNGAGKTSTLEVIEGLAEASSGEVRVRGLDPIADRDEVRRHTGTLLQTSGFPGDLTVRETVNMWADTLSEPRPVDEALAMLGLEQRASVRVRGLSGGEQRRLDLACTLLGRPDVVLLDEPTTGLDPESRRAVWELIRQLRHDGATVLLTTHYLEEAEELADRLEIMHAGRIVRSGTVAEVAQGHPSTIRFRSAGPPVWLSELDIGELTVRDDHVTIDTHDLQGALTALLDRAARERCRLDDLDARTASLESVFLSIAAEPRDAHAHDIPEGATR